MKIFFGGLLVVTGLLLTSCGTQCPAGVNVTDPSCPGYSPYGYQQPYQQPYPGTVPTPNYYQPGAAYPQQPGIYPQQPGMYPPVPGQPYYRPY